MATIENENKNYFCKGLSMYSVADFSNDNLYTFTSEVQIDAIITNLPPEETTHTESFPRLLRVSIP